ncbi:MAG: exo-alpha-sialidase [Alphaproteobacteria bacterium]|nr:exo-alpha-sialidase [Alphaproteobacteria bacterium]
MIRRTVAWVSIIALLPMASALAEEHTVDLSALAHIHGIAFTQSPADGLILATHHGVYSVDLAGASTLISQPDDFMGFTGLGGNRFIASGHPATGGNLGVLLSDNGGADWNRLADGANGPVDFHAMTVSGVDGQTIYGLYGGLQLSRYGGTSWTQIGPGVDGTIDIAATPDKAGSLYAGTRSGLMFSTDFGLTWTLQGPEGIPVTAVETTTSGSVYSFFAGAGLYIRSADGMWSELANDFGDRVVLHIAVNETSPEQMAVVLDDSAVLFSADGGVTWQALGP